MQTYLRAGIVLLSILLVLVACSNTENENRQKKKKEVHITISAAVSLKESLEEIEMIYVKDHPEVKLDFNFGGSGSLQQQISQGAPVDIFFSAAEDKFDLLVDDGAIAKEDGVDLLKNELVLVVPKGDISRIASLEDVTKDEVGRISIGTPETVPAGKYAKESLESLHIWNSVQEKTIYAKDVRQVLSYVETGNVEAGLVYKTDALVSEKVVIAASVDTDTHASIVYPVGVLRKSKQYEAAKEFYEYLQSAAALKVFDKYGFITE